VGVRRALVHTALLAAAVVGLDGAAGAGLRGAVERLPDLRVGQLYGVDLEPGDGRRTLLRFGTVGWNVGDGPIEARGYRNDSEDLVMRVRQRIYNSAGGHRDRITPSVMLYDTGDNHDHWHTRQFMVVQMYKRGSPTASVYGLRKIGYCLLDAAHMADPPPGSPPERVYGSGTCGSRSSTSVQTGLSVGYGDDYPPNYAHQWMDVTDIRAGTYRICTTIDPLEEFVEKVETNNQRWTDVRIDLSTGQVAVLATAVGACGPTVP